MLQLRKYESFDAHEIEHFVAIVPGLVIPGNVG